MTFRRMTAALETRLAAAGLTYPEVGQTATDLPTGYSHLRCGATLTSRTFADAAARLMSWEVHRRAGLTVTASGPVAPGAVVTLGLGPLRFAVTAPCRVVYTIDEADRVGFAYGTLPGHPESGEEAFVVSRVEGGARLDITAFSRPATAMAVVVGPVGRAGQRLITRRYLWSADH